MNKDEKLNEAIPDDREPKQVMVRRGDETFRYTPGDEEVDEIVITGGGGVFVLVEDLDGEDLVYRYGPSSVEEIVYQNTGYDEELDQDQDEESDNDGE